MHAVFIRRNAATFVKPRNIRELIFSVFATPNGHEFTVYYSEMIWKNTLLHFWKLETSGKP